MKRVSRWAAAIVLIVLVGGACALFSGMLSDRASTPAVRGVNVRLGWQVNANSAGQIVAYELGMYRHSGLEVSFYPGGLKDSSAFTVGSGADDIGFANGPAQVFQARASGAPLRIVAVIQSTGYHAFFSKADSGIRSPADWKGRSVGVKYGSPTFPLYLMMLRRFGVDRSQIVEVPLNYGLQPFLEGTVDVYPGAITNEMLTFRKLGLDIVVIRPEDCGLTSCGSVVVTSDDFLGRNRSTVREFVDVTLAGWRWSLDPAHEDHTLDVLGRHSPQMDREKERESLRMNRELVLPASRGSIDVERLGRMFREMQDAGILRRELEIGDVIDPSVME